MEVKSFTVKNRKIPDKPFVILQPHLMQLSNATFGLKTKLSCMEAFFPSLGPRHRGVRFPGMLCLVGQGVRKLLLSRIGFELDFPEQGQ